MREVARMSASWLLRVIEDDLDLGPIPELHEDDPLQATIEGRGRHLDTLGTLVEGSTDPVLVDAQDPRAGGFPDHA
jgi:hypothetical protein